jgi:hypothetical protein
VEVFDWLHIVPRGQAAGESTGSEGGRDMIEKTLGYKVGQLFFPCIAEAQRHEIEELLRAGESGSIGFTPENIAAFILTHQDKILDILTTTPTSKVRARKINGGTKRRKKQDEQITKVDSI